MARSPKPGDSFPYSLVGKENPVPESDQTIQNAAAAAKETSTQAIQDIAEQLKALRTQVQALQATTADIASRTGKVVASTARVAGSKVAGEARAASDKAVAGAKATGQTVASTVEAYPLSAVLIASATAFLLGRMTAASWREPSYSDYAESTFDHLRGKLHDLSSRLPPHLRSTLRSSLR